MGPEQPVLFEFPKISENFENEYLGNERGYEFQRNVKRSTLHAESQYSKNSISVYDGLNTVCI